jgi:uncharacterized protein
MAKWLLMLLMIFAGATAFSQTKIDSTRKYDPELAKKLGADDYGMRTYVIAFLKAGPVKMPDSASRAALQNAHLKNIFRLASEGKLIIAGPFLDNKELRGIFVFTVSTIEEARKLVETDPAVKAGVLTMELHPWYGSAALMETLEIEKRIQKKSIGD